ncbi:MAG: divergent polysaccharide deacetylase family protein, partial [Proteobacteria bacterium]|nr:divergent polysaccharide deacetylase family protein [Pseudomonadota bacterium]
AVAPILRETAKRGLLYFDDRSSARSVVSQVAGANRMAFARADVVLDAVPTPAEVDRALARLEKVARERGVAIGVTGALPVTIDHIAAWAKAVESRGFSLVPLTATVAKPKST